MDGGRRVTRGPYASGDRDQLMVDTNRTEVPAAWLTRAGRHGEREDFVLEHGLAGSGFHRLPDLSSVSNRVEMEIIVRKLLPDKTKMSVANYVGQLWALRAGVQAGDLVVLPRKGTRELNLPGFHAGCLL